MKQPIEADYEVIPKGGAIEVHFRPTDSYFLFTRLVDAKDVERFGPLSPDVKVRHANRTGDLDDYSAESAKVYEMALRAALKYVEGRQQ